MSSKRNVYLKMKPLKEAREILFDRFSHLGMLSGETVSVPDAVGRVLAEPVFAKLSSPNFHAAAMDGIAVKAENTFGASETQPKTLINDKDAFFVNTGNVLPETTNAVIMIEHVNVLDEHHLEIENPAFDRAAVGIIVIHPELIVFPVIIRGDYPCRRRPVEQGETLRPGQARKPEPSRRGRHHGYFLPGAVSLSSQAYPVYPVKAGNCKADII